MTENKKMVYDSQEVQKLLKGVKGTDMEMPLTLIIDATLRRGEALALTWSDIDFEEGTIRIDKDWVDGMDNLAVFSTPKSKASWSFSWSKGLTAVLVYPTCQGSSHQVTDEFRNYMEDFPWRRTMKS